MFVKSIQCIVPVAVGGFFIGKPSPIHNDTKRNFYEDEKDIEPVPGSTIPNENQQQQPQQQTKLVNGVVVNSPSSVESVFKSIRNSISKASTAVEQYADQGYNRYYSTERRVTQTVSDLHDKSEDLLPNSLYIVVAGLSGLIMARQRSIFAKMTFPVVLGLCSFKYFLPQTFTSTKNFVWNVEKQKLPEIAKQQEAMITKSGELVSQLEKTTESSQSSVINAIGSLKKSIKKYSGLNVDDDVTKK